MGEEDGGQADTAPLDHQPDRNDPNRYLVFAFFDSYESAMANSNLPETTEFGLSKTALLDGPPVFWDLDVVTDDVS